MSRHETPVLPNPAAMRARSVAYALRNDVTGTDAYRNVLQALNKSEGQSENAATVQGIITHEYVDVIMDYYLGILEDIRYLKAWLKDHRYHAEQISVNGSRIGLRVCWDMQVTTWMLGIKTDIDGRPICPCNACGAEQAACRKDRCALYGHYLHFAGKDGDGA